MKEKRYFCDLMLNKKGSNGLTGVIMLMLFCIIASISGEIYYKCLVLKYGNELDSYSESTYQYLDEIADNVIKEGVGINLLAMPDDVVKYEIISENNEIIFKYYLENNKGMQFTNSAVMTIELSDNFEMISKKPNYSSEEDYIKKTKFGMILVSALVGGMVSVLALAIGFAGIMIGILVSQANKNKNLS